MPQRLRHSATPHPPSPFPHAQAHDENKIKLLLLGAGESGKSTIFKQMKILYGSHDDKSQEDYDLTRTIVHSNTIGAMKILVEMCQQFGLTCPLDTEFNSLAEVDENDELTEELGAHIKALWADDVIQEVWERRAEFQIVESLKFYFKNIDRVCLPTYMNAATFDVYTNADHTQYQKDMLYARVRTSGIVVDNYEIEGKPFEMYDVGGQRNERRKWIHCFEDVTCVIFVAALSEYNQMLFEDATTNRMIEAIQLFDDIVNNTVFARTSFILFLNKKDLFEEKILKVAIADTPDFADYTGGEDIEAGQNYFKAKFVKMAKPNAETGDAKTIYSHATCATDTENVKRVMDSCKDTILRQNLSDSGFM